MYHIVYLTTNLVNHKIYIGVHSTYNLDDGYLGSGKTLLKAINKYGEQNFKRTILHYCLEAKHAYELEKQIVDESFIKRKNTYNIKTGGYGSWSHCNYKPHSKEHNKKISKALKGISKPRSEPSKLKQSLTVMGSNNPFYGKKHTEESKQKIASREYTNKIKIKINDIEYDSIKDAYINLNLGVNYLTQIVKELKKLNNNRITKYHKFLKQYLYIELL